MYLVMTTKDQQKPKNLKQRFMNWLGLTKEGTIKVYHGYGYNDQLIVYGHVFKFSPTPRKKYRKSFLRNTWALLRLFMVEPFPYLNLEMDWKDQVFFCETDTDGFFKFDWKDQPPLPQGWNEVSVTAKINNVVI